MLSSAEIELTRMMHEMYEKDMPDLWKLVYPRIYTEPKCGQYYSPKTPARQLMTIAIKVLNGLIGSSEQYEFQLASHLVKYRVPTYWLSESITEALTRTTFPGMIDWYNMMLPFPAAVFMLPKGILRHKTDGEVEFICFGRFVENEVLRSLLVPNRSYGLINGGMQIAAKVEGGFFLHWNIPLNFYGPKLTMKQLHDLMRNFSKFEHPSAVPLHNQQTHMDENDHQLGDDVAHLIFSTLMLMTARPELVSVGKMINRVAAKKGREAREFWSPHVIGEHYKLQRPPVPYQGGTHASPRFHWVQGFWREQPYGPRQDNKRYTKWIEPYTRGLE